MTYGRLGLLLLLIMTLMGCAECVDVYNRFCDMNCRERPNTARVIYDGNIYTSRNAIDNDVLYQCAKITVKHGFDYFIIGTTDTTPSYHPILIEEPPLHCSRPGRGSVIYIKMYCGFKPEQLPNAYDAHAILRYRLANSEWNTSAR